MLKKLCIILFFVNIQLTTAQTGPWNSPLKIARSIDGITFGTPEIFQDSAGVPSIIRWHGDTLISAFQWFRQPIGSPSWDRVAVKFSYDKGLTWTEPTPIVLPDLPTGYQRPFDPTLVVAPGGGIRIFYSSGITKGLLDSLINTYSALSADGIHYTFEAGARVDHPTTQAIDPAVTWFHGMWHYACPYGPPPFIAYHAISSDGINFTRVPDIISDAIHNWTGNYMVNDTDELRFYGCGSTAIWYNHSKNGGAWDGYVSTNINGGDPSVVKVEDGNYIMVYVGPPKSTAITTATATPSITVYPNPCTSLLSISCSTCTNQPVTISVIDAQGRVVLSKYFPSCLDVHCMDMEALLPGNYLLKLDVNGRCYEQKVIKTER